MTVKRLAGIFSAEWSFVGTLFFFDSQTKSFVDSHTRASNALRRLKEADTTADSRRASCPFRNAARVTTPCRGHLTQSRRAKTTFGKSAGAAYGTVARKIPHRRRSKSPRAIGNVKAELIEDFKSRNAILKNSQSYVPVVARGHVRPSGREASRARLTIPAQAPIR